MGPYQRTPKEVTGAIRYSGSGVRSVGPVGDFLEYSSTWSSYVAPIEIRGCLMMMPQMVTKGSVSPH